MGSVPLQQPNVLRTVAAGAAGLVVFIIVNAVGFSLADAILFDPKIQSAKLIAVWDEIEPLPPAHGEVATLSILIFIYIGRAFVYRWLAVGWPPGVVPRALRYGLLIWFLSFFFVEFSAAFTLFGEPVGLVFIELTILGIAALAESFVMAGIMEQSRRRVAGGRFDGGV